MRARLLIVTGAAGLVLADASIVTLALPELLRALNTTVEGVAAVIAVYTLVLALALLPAERLMRRHGAARVGSAGFALFAVASAVCASSDSLALLLVARAMQALGGAAGLVAAFALIDGGGRTGRRHWLGAAVLSAAVGPALGGALTEAFDWRAIFVFQVPVALAAALVFWPRRGWRAGPVADIGDPTSKVAGSSDVTPTARSASGGPGGGVGVVGPAGLAADIGGGAGRGLAPSVAPSAARVSRPIALLPAVALALLSAALTAVLFLLVLLLVAGWAMSPLGAAATVTILPLAALAGSRIGGPPRQRAAAGALLVGAGVLALAWLPDAAVWWTFLPQALAGVGMGMALPAFAGELLPEQTPHDAAWLLTIRHAGIALVLIAVAPLIAHQLDTTTERAKERGVALVLDARLPPQDKLSLAPALLSGVDADQPRAGLDQALDAHRGDFDGQERATYDTLATRADDTVVTAVGEAFRPAFLIAGALAVLAALALLATKASEATRAPTAGRPANADRAGGVRRDDPGSLLTGSPDASTGPARRPRPALAVITALALLAATPAAYATAHEAVAPTPVKLADPCGNRRLPDTGGITGFLQDRALEALDTAACRLGSSREELVLALADKREAKRFERRHGVDPRSVGSLLQGLLSP